MVLPPIKECKMTFLKQILRGEKKPPKNSDLKPIKIPHYNELSVGSLYPEFLNEPKFVFAIQDYDRGNQPS